MACLRDRSRDSSMKINSLTRLSLALALSAGALFASDAKAPAATPAATATATPPPAPPAVSADQILAMLAEGNQRFVDGKAINPNADSWRRTVTATDGQKPLVTILSCSDSREVPEILFDRGIGDLFIIRVAGNVVDKAVTASVEYGCGHLNTPVLLVLGHTKCGAVAACVTNAEVHGSLPDLLAHINDAEKAARAKHPGARDDEIIRMTVVENVWTSMRDLLTASTELRHLANEGKLRVVGGIYDIQAGTVKILGRHPEERALLALKTTDSHGEKSDKPAEAGTHH